MWSRTKGTTISTPATQTGLFKVQLHAKETREVILKAIKGKLSKTVIGSGVREEIRAASSTILTNKEKGKEEHLVLFPTMATCDTNQQVEDIIPTRSAQGLDSSSTGH